MTEITVKKHFRVLEYKKGFINLSEPQIKTWIGWRSFSCHGNGSFYFDSSPNRNLEFTNEHIENYRQMKGLTKDEISIINVVK